MLIQKFEVKMGGSFLFALRKGERGACAWVSLPPGIRVVNSLLWATADFESGVLAEYYDSGISVLSWKIDRV